MNKVIYLKDESIHIIRSEQDVLNIIEDYCGFDFKQLVQDIIKEKDECADKCNECEYRSVIEQIKDIACFL